MNEIKRQGRKENEKLIRMYKNVLGESAFAKVGTDTLLKLALKPDSFVASDLALATLSQDFEFGKKKITIATGNLSPADKDLLSVSYPNYLIDYVPASYNGHPMAYACRMLEGMDMMDRLFREVPKPSGKAYTHHFIDIGGNIGSHFLRGDSWHSCTPTLSARDSTRHLSSMLRSMVGIKPDRENSSLTEYQCGKIAQVCNAKAPGVMFLQSPYDMRPYDIAESMNQKDALVGYATFIAPLGLLCGHTSGQIPQQHAHWVVRDLKKNFFDPMDVKNMVTFYFEGDTSFCYSHKASILYDLMITKHVECAGKHYLFEHTLMPTGTMLLKIIRVVNPSPSCILTSTMDMKKYFPDEVFLRTWRWQSEFINEKEHLKLLPIVIPLPTKFYDRIYSIVATLTDTAFTPFAVTKAVIGSNRNVTTGGLNYTAVDGVIPADKIIDVATGIFLIVYSQKYCQTKVVENIVRELKTNRDDCDFVSKFAKKGWSRFCDSFLSFFRFSMCGGIDHPVYAQRTPSVMYFDQYVDSIRTDSFQMYEFEVQSDDTLVPIQRALEAEALNNPAAIYESKRVPMAKCVLDGYQRIAVPGGGNCMFYALIGVADLGFDVNGLKLYMRDTEYYRGRPERLRDALDNILLVDAAWGDDHILSLFCEVFSCTLCVHERDVDFVHHFTCGVPGAKVFHLEYDDQHYWFFSVIERPISSQREKLYIPTNFIDCNSTSQLESLRRDIVLYKKTKPHDLASALDRATLIRAPVQLQLARDELSLLHLLYSSMEDFRSVRTVFLNTSARFFRVYNANPDEVVVSNHNGEHMLMPDFAVPAASVIQAIPNVNDAVDYLCVGSDDLEEQDGWLAICEACVHLRFHEESKLIVSCNVHRMPATMFQFLATCFKEVEIFRSYYSDPQSKKFVFIATGYSRRDIFDTQIESMKNKMMQTAAEMMTVDLIRVKRCMKYGTEDYNLSSVASNVIASLDFRGLPFRGGAIFSDRLRAAFTSLQFWKKHPDLHGLETYGFAVKIPVDLVRQADLMRKTRVTLKEPVAPQFECKFSPPDREQIKSKDIDGGLLSRDEICAIRPLPAAVDVEKIPIGILPFTSGLTDVEKRDRDDSNRKGKRNLVNDVVLVAGQSIGNLSGIEIRQKLLTERFEYTCLDVDGPRSYLVNSTRELRAYWRYSKFLFCRQSFEVLLRVRVLMAGGRPFSGALVVMATHGNDDMVVFHNGIPSEQIVETFTHVTTYENGELCIVPFEKFIENPPEIAVADKKYCIYLDYAMYLATMEVDYELELPQIDFIQGVPGCGKSTYIVENCAPEQDLVLLSTREGVADMIRRIHAQTNISEQNLKCNVRTVPSYFLNSRAKYKHVWIDEALMHHPGVIFLVCSFARPDRIFMLGDRCQIPYVNRSILSLKYTSFSDQITITKRLNVSFRCPQDIAAMFNHLYTKLGGVFTTNSEVKVSVDYSFFTEERYLIEKMGAYDVVLTFKQVEAAYLRTLLTHVVSGSDKKCVVHTVHEYQGMTAKKVLLVRLGLKEKEEIYSSLPHILVALTRHTQEFYYYSKLRAKDSVVTLIVDSHNRCGIPDKFDKTRRAGSTLRHGGEIPIYTPNFSYDFLTHYSDFTNKKISAKTIYLSNYERKGTVCIKDRSGQLNVKPLVSILADGGSFNIDYHNARSVVAAPSALYKKLERIYPGQVGYAGPAADPIAQNRCDFVDAYMNGNAMVDIPIEVLTDYERQYVPSPKITAPVVRVDAQTIESLYEQAFPKFVGFDVTEFEKMVPYCDINLEYNEKVKICDVANIENESKFGYMTPRIQTVVPSVRPRNFFESLYSLVKRNLSVPEISTINDDEYIALQMYEKFIDAYFDELPDFPVIDVNATAILQWLNDQNSQKVGIEDIERFLLWANDLNKYEFMIKKQPKPKLDDSAIREYPALQTICYQGLLTNALLCPIFKEIRRRIVACLDKKFDIFCDMSPKDFAFSLNAKGVKPLEHKLEVDISKYDKSQGRAMLLFEMMVFERFGLKSAYLPLWEYMHEKTRLVDRQSKISTDVWFQRKSGDAATFLGNTIVLMGVLATAYDMKDAGYACFAGDDSLIFSSVPFDDRSEFLSDIYNLESKLFKYDFSSFCSKFLFCVDDFWYFIPDPFKILMKMGRRDLRNPTHVEEYRNALVDLTQDYDNMIIYDSIDNAIAERYSVLMPFGFTAQMHRVFREKKLFDDLFYDSGEKPLLIDAGSLPEI